MWKGNVNSSRKFCSNFSYNTIVIRHKTKKCIVKKYLYTTGQLREQCTVYCK